MENKKRGFTLAEVLITLAIIGVVAAMTIPTLLAKINTIVEDNQKKVFEAKIIKGLNLTKAAGELNNTYTSTADFLENGLGKHLKITKICGPTEMRKCVPYDNINYIYNNADDIVAVKDVDTVEELNLNPSNGFKDIASFVMGDGTVVIASYNQDCIVDDGELDKSISSCLAGIYDLNGSRKPNKLGKDLVTFNGATLNIDHGPAVLATFNGVKIISNAEVPTPIRTSDLCDTSDSNSANWTVKSEYTKYGITKCTSYANADDYWAGAMIACQDMGGRLPTQTELTNIASELYNTIVTLKGTTDATLDTSKIPTPLSGLGSSWSSLWSSSTEDGIGIIARVFYTINTYRVAGYSDDSSRKAICVAK